PLERALPRRDEKRLSDAQAEELGELALRAIEAALQRDVQQSVQLHVRAMPFIHTNEQKLVAAAMGYAIGDKELALTFCNNILASRPARLVALEATRLIWLLDDYDSLAFRHAAHLADRRSIVQFDVHMMMAHFLAADQHSLAAINHYKYLL